MPSSRSPRRELWGAAAMIAFGLFVAIVIVVVVVGRPAPKETYVGEVDLQSACDHQYPGEERELVQRELGNPYTWACVAADGRSDGIEVSAECARVYGVGVSARIGAGSTASWECVRNEGEGS